MSLLDEKSTARHGDWIIWKRQTQRHTPARSLIDGVSLFDINQYNA